MLLNSISFLLFFPLIALIYFIIPKKFQWGWLLLSSYYFYLVNDSRFFFLIVFSTLITYYISIKLESLELSGKKKFLLVLAIILNLAGLVFFKYFNFLSDSVISLLNIFNFQLDPIFLKLLLPLGISFYSFQNIGYLIDVYHKKIPAEKNLGIFSLYVSFFPKVINGPIERAGKLLPQFHQNHDFNYENAKEGLKLVLWGFFKKLVIADRLAGLVSVVYSNPTHFEGFYLIIATIAFGFQLYMDFSGYTDMALGFARILGYNLTQNFRRPYLSKNPAEFWRRWHISLSSWFQDYIFTPLYLKISRIKSMEKLSTESRHHISFFISLFIGEALLGLWHGANWTFVLFGIYYAFVIFAYYYLRMYWDKINPYIQIMITFVLVFIAWILFRVNNLSDAGYFFSHILNFGAVNIRLLGIRFSELFLTLFFILVVMIIEIIEEFLPQFPQRIFTKFKWLKWMGYIFIFLCLLLFGVFDATKFIYAQF